MQAVRCQEPLPCPADCESGAPQGRGSLLYAHWAWHLWIKNQVRVYFSFSVGVREHDRHWFTDPFSFVSVIVFDKKNIKKYKSCEEDLFLFFFTWCDLFWAANPAYKSHCTAAPFRGFIHEQESRTLPVKGQYAGCSGRVLCWAVSMVSCLPWLLSHKLSSIFFVKG